MIGGYRLQELPNILKYSDCLRNAASIVLGALVTKQSLYSCQKERDFIREAKMPLKFKKSLISKETYETASVFDVDGDGILDIVSGG